MDERLARTVAAIREAGADWAVLTAPDSVAYATGWFEPAEAGLAAFAAGPATALIGRDGSAGLVAPVRPDMAARTAQLEIFDNYGEHHAQPATLAHGEALGRLSRALGVTGVLGIEPASCTQAVLAALPAAPTIDLVHWLRRQRASKTDDELAALRRCAAIAAAGQSTLLDPTALTPGITELELFSRVRRRMEAQAGERVTVAGDLVSGRARTARIGGWPGIRRIERHDAVLADLAPQVGGYWGDSCATIVLGKASAAQSRLFQAAQAGLRHAIEILRPGITAGDLHRAVRSRVQREGGDYPHHTGHSIGTAVHEHPRLCDAETMTLRAGMVLMIEPGAYDPDVGGVRLEWMFRVTEGGCEPMAPFPHHVSLL